MEMKYHNLERFRKSILSSAFGCKKRALKDTITSLNKYRDAKNMTEKVLERIKVLEIINLSFSKKKNRPARL